MLSYNKKKVGDKIVKNRTGGNANESRFFTTEKELRKHKSLIIPSANTNAMVKMEQGWNKKAREKDIVRITLGDKYTIVTREELEQVVAALAQGMEAIKYQTLSTKKI